MEVHKNMRDYQINETKLETVIGIYSISISGDATISISHSFSRIHNSLIDASGAGIPFRTVSFLLLKCTLFMVSGPVRLIHVRDKFNEIKKVS